MRKTLCLIILFMTCLYASSALATDISFEYSPVVSGEWVYMFTKDRNAALIGYLGSDTSVTVPAEIDGMQVTDLYNTFAWFYTTTDDGLLDLPYHEAVHGYINWVSANNDCAIEEVSVPEGVTCVDGAFAYCRQLRRIELPDSLKILGNNTFLGCSALEAVDLPDSLEIIGDTAFSQTALSAVELPDREIDIADYAFDEEVTVIGGSYDRPVTRTSGDWEFLVYPRKGYAVATGYSGSATAVTVPSEIDGLPVVTVGPFTLGLYPVRVYGRTAYMSSFIEYLAIPEGVTRIEKMNLGSELMGVSLPSTLEVIGAGAFSRCDSLIAIEIPEGVTTIGDDAFTLCRSLSDVRLPSTLKTIGDRSFLHCTELAAITLPESITQIGNAAFNDCIALKEITIPESVTKIGSSAFNECTALTSVRLLSNSLTEIHSYTFNGCTALTEIVLPEGLTHISDHAFQNCTALTSVKLPGTLTLIDREAFSGCASLTRIELADSLDYLHISEAAFQGTGLTEIDLPENVEYDGGAFDESVTLTGGAKESVTYWAIDGLLYAIHIAEGYAVIDGYDGPSKTVMIPDQVPKGTYEGYPVTGIEFGAFSGQMIESVLIPESVTSIGAYAFSGCTALTSVDLPSSLASSLYCAFDDSGVKEITIPDGLTYMTFDDTITVHGGKHVLFQTVEDGFGYQLFMSDGYAILAWYIGEEADVVIPAEARGLPVTALDMRSMQELPGLRSVVIPEGVTEIGEGAFQNCAALVSVILPSTLTIIGPGAFAGCTALAEVVLPEGATVAEDAFDPVTTVIWP